MHLTHRYVARASPVPFSYLNNLYGFRWLQMKGLLLSLLLHFSVLRGGLSAFLITETSRCSRRQLPDSRGSKQTSARARNCKTASAFRWHDASGSSLAPCQSTGLLLSCSLKLPLLLLKWSGFSKTKAQVEPMSDGDMNLHMPMMQNIKAESWWHSLTLLLPAKYLLLLR